MIYIPIYKYSQAFKPNLFQNHRWSFFNNVDINVLVNCFH